MGKNILPGYAEASSLFPRGLPLEWPIRYTARVLFRFHRRRVELRSAGVC